MGARTVEELTAYQIARELKLEVYRLVDRHPAARQDYRFRSQLFEAVASNEVNIAEGFRRFVPGEFAHFLSFARASLEEARLRLRDGIDRGYFDETACRRAFELSDRSGRLTMALHRHLRRRQARCLVAARHRHPVTDTQHAAPSTQHAPQNAPPPSLPTLHGRSATT